MSFDGIVVAIAILIVLSIDVSIGNDFRRMKDTSSLVMWMGFNVLALCLLYLIAKYGRK